jgi:hypothetical protein
VIAGANMAAAGRLKTVRRVIFFTAGKSRLSIMCAPLYEIELL